MNMLLENTFIYDWFGSIFRLVALLILYVFVTISSVSTLDKYREIKRDNGFDKSKGKYKGLSVLTIILNSLLLGIIGVLIVSPIILSEEKFMMYELVSGTVLCVLFVWLIVDITYHKNLEKNKFSLLIILYGGFILLLVMELIFKGRMLIFITIFVLYINLELNGATAWVIWEIDREKNKKLVLISLLSFCFVPILYVLCSIYPDPAVQAALGVSAIAHALIVVYYSEFFSEKKQDLTIAGLISFSAAIGISLFLPNPISGGSISSLLVASSMYSFCLIYLINILMKRVLKFEKGHRSTTLLVSLALTLGFWGLFLVLETIFVSARGILTLQSDFLNLLTLSPPAWFSFMIASSQTVGFGILLSIAAYDLPWIKELIEWLKKHEKLFIYTSFICFIGLVALLIICAISPAIFSTFPTIWTLFAIFGIVGLVCFGASIYGGSVGFDLLVYCYIGLGFAYAIVFAPMSLGILGIIGLVILTGAILGFLITMRSKLKITIPFVVAILSMILGLTLMNIRIINRITNPATATLAELFEWFFAMVFAANAVVTSFFLSEEKEKLMVYVFISGVVFASVAHLVLFVWDTRFSIALSYSWIASSVALMLPSLFVLFKYLWNSLHIDKWSSLITSIFASVFLMIASGTKFTPGISDFANSIISLVIAIGLVIGYYIYAKKKTDAILKQSMKKLPPIDKFQNIEPVDDKPRKEDFPKEKR